MDDGSSTHRAVTIGSRLRVTTLRTTAVSRNKSQISTWGKVSHRPSDGARISAPCQRISIAIARPPRPKIRLLLRRSGEKRLVNTNSTAASRQSNSDRIATCTSKGDAIAVMALADAAQLVAGEFHGGGPGRACGTG